MTSLEFMDAKHSVNAIKLARKIKHDKLEKSEMTYLEKAMRKLSFKDQTEIRNLLKG